MHPNRVWAKHIFIAKDDYSTINRRWNWIGAQENWKAYWKKLWRGWALATSRMLIWRIVQHGFATNHKAKKWNVNDGACPRCDLHQETINHLFLIQCSISKNWWIDMERFLCATEMGTDYGLQWSFFHHSKIYSRNEKETRITDYCCWNMQAYLERMERCHIQKELLPGT